VVALTAVSPCRQLIITARLVQREATGVTSNLAVLIIVRVTHWEPSASVAKATSFTAAAWTASVRRFLTYFNYFIDETITSTSA